MTFIKEAIDEMGNGVESEKMDPHTIQQLRDWSRKINASMHPEPNLFIQKVETRLNVYGYTIITDKNDIGNMKSFPDKGKLLFDIFRVAGKDIVENVFLSVEFVRAGANSRVPERPYGGKNFYSYNIEFVEE